MKRAVYPFAAVLGQDEVKRALLCNLVNPMVGGVLISGEKGTAKSTLVRGLEALTDKEKLVELPLNVTEDRLVGSIDLSRALLDGRSVLEPGILWEANGNILYVDEVNLLSDHIINTLLGVAAGKRNVVEREGISCAHESSFVLIGSMNPEEGRLRPQFLDRFGLYVEVRGEKDPATRVEIMGRRLEYERDPAGFLEAWQEETRRLQRKIQRARELLPEVEITGNALQLASSLSENVHCCGHRGELATVEAARAIAALDGRRMMNTEDIREAARFALAHRARETAPEITSSPENNPADGEEHGQEDSPEREQQPEENREENPPENHEEDPVPQPPEEGENREKEQETDPSDGEFGRSEQRRQGADGEERAGEFGQSEEVQETGEVFEIPRWQEAPALRRVNQGAGKRTLVRSENHQGRYVGYRAANEEKVTDLAFDATVRAAAPYQKNREKNGRAIAVERSDMRVKIREKRTGGCILFVVDASASMGANRRMEEVKAAIVSLLNVSYQKRDRVGLIAFRKDRAELLLGITRSVELAQKKLADLPTGGKTPLAAGLDLAYEVIMGLKMREPEISPTIVLVSDGRASGKKNKNSNPFAEALHSAERIGNQKIHTIILDTENGFIRFHLCHKLNEKLKGTLLTMEELRAEGIVEAVTE